MNRPVNLPFIGWLLWLSMAGVCNGQRVSFNQHVRPLLSDRCFVCHGPDESQRAADLRLDTREGLKRVVRSGDPDASQLVTRIESADEDLRMPPPHSNLNLSGQEVALLRKWISEGAQWEQHWSFSPIVATKIPQPKQTDLIRSPIDAFILDRLEREGMSFSELASKEKLMRRVSLDLTGLPPSVGELDQYLADDSADAYERLVDSLLASPRFGERAASHWLDLARYSDTYGYQVDHDRFVWPWRDWVVNSFNSNKPFDQFVVEQIAGDLLPAPTADQVLATAFNRLHPQKVEGGSIEEEFRTEYVADRVHTFATAFLGLTVECARCHDHKFDPLSMKEYYQLFAFFNSIDEAGLCSYFDPHAVPTPALELTDATQKRQLELLQSDVETANRNLQHFISDFRATHTLTSHADLARGGSSLSKSSCTQQFDEWLNNISVRKQLAQTEAKRLSQSIEFTDEMIGRNIRTTNEEGVSEIQFTGDDEIKIDAGKYSREQPFSIAARIKMAPAENGQPVQRAVLLHCSRAWTDSASRGYQLLIENGKLSAALIHFWPGNAICIQTVDRVPVDQWMDVLLTYDGSSSAEGLRIYLNGILQPTTVVRNNLTRNILGNGTDQLIIGARFRDVGFANGKMAYLQHFPLELHAWEVQQRQDRRSLTELLSRDTDELTGAEREHLLGYFLCRYCREANVLREKLQATRQKLFSYQDGLQQIMVMRESPGLRPTFRLARGAYDAPAEQVYANTPSMLPELPKPVGREPNRLDLANWLVASNHPLTARVAVNQYWQLLFGTGLVRTPEDFGSQSQPPAHRELLDWLAADFQKDWDLKRCLKQMVMSTTYRQTSQINSDIRQRDPENLLFGRAAMYRLPAEILRDSLLLQSGLLVEKAGGPPVRPYDLELAFSPVPRDAGEDLYRRSLYTYWKRTSTSPAMVVLDAPNRDVCRVSRDRTSSPLQSLLLLNGTQFVEAARKLGENTLAEYPHDSTKVAQSLFRRLTSRHASEQELAVLVNLFHQQQERYSAAPQLAERLISIGESKSDYQDKVKLAAWTTVANMLMNLEEVTHRH